MAGFDITFHPGWWFKHGFSFEEKFFIDADHRIEQDRGMRRVLYEEYGHAGLGEKDPAPRPIMDSDLLAGEYLQAQLLGCEVTFYPDRLPYTGSMEISDGDIADLKPPDLDKGLWLVYDSQFKRLMERFGRVDSCIDLHGIQNLALAIRGYELFEDYQEEPELAQAVLSVAYETVASVARAIRRYTRCIGAGVSSAVRLHDPEIYLTSNCSCDLISASTYKDHVFDWDKKLAGEFRPFGIHYCGGSMQRLAPVFAGLEPDFVEIGALSDVYDSLQNFPVKTYINLRVSPALLLNGKPDEIREAVSGIKNQALKAGFPNTTLSAVGIDPETPKENLNAFFEAAGKVPK